MSFDNEIPIALQIKEWEIENKPLSATQEELELLSRIKTLRAIRGLKND